MIELFNSHMEEALEILNSDSMPIIITYVACTVAALLVTFIVWSAIARAMRKPEKKPSTTPSGETGMKFKKNMVGRSIRVQWSGSKSTPTLEGRITQVVDETQVMVKYEDGYVEIVDSKFHRIELISRKRDMANAIIRGLSPRKTKSKKKE